MPSSYFETFHRLLEKRPQPIARLTDIDKYFAHLHDSKFPEGLLAHLNLVGEYALKLIQIHQLDPVADRLIEDLLVNFRDDSSVKKMGNFIKLLFLNAILFHDYGKINERFQVERMNNAYFKKQLLPNRFGSKHSLLSAVLFVANHIQQLQLETSLSKKQQAFLTFLVYAFASVILKHHASGFDYDLNIPVEWLLDMKPYFKKLNIEVEPQLLHHGFAGMAGNSSFLRFADAFFKKTSEFPLFGLLRLCFSLLTAADYYATTQYMNDLKVDDFGVLNDFEKTQLYQSFQTTKSYNKEFFQRRAYFSALDLDQLKERNPQNLNLVRQKLMADVLNSLNEKKDEYIFYLEAPTGSGKTNLSMAIAMELLKAHPLINKIFYVFPFTTLITQTAKSLQETLNVTNEQMVLLHSRSGFVDKREQEEDGQYGPAHHLNYIDNLFVNYPVVLLTHIKFFDILKSIGKENIYLLHRLANSVVIIDELQSYNPREWDKIRFFIANYARYFNIRFVLMSATLPKLDALILPGQFQQNLPQHFVPLLSDSLAYFQNANFRERVQFDFSLFEKAIQLEELADFVFEKCEQYAGENGGRVRAIIEFIFKRSAGQFYQLVEKRFRQANYQLFLLSGVILEPRRREIIDYIKRAGQSSGHKILLITTQVVEAGVDIDMDIGFKDRSLIDSDEQLAGRVNRNARPIPARLYLFKLDKAYAIYGSDLRYKLTRDQLSTDDYRSILQNKRFDLLYQKVCDYINKENANTFIRGFHSYLENFRYLRFAKVDWEFQLIRERTETVFVPLPISKDYFSNEALTFLEHFTGSPFASTVDGQKIWEIYLAIIHNKEGSFIRRQIQIKRIYGIMSQFMFSIYSDGSQFMALKPYADLEIYNKYKILYLSHWKDIYDYESGLLDQKLGDALFL